MEFTKDDEVFNRAVTEAKASRKLFRIIHDFKEGKKIEFLTDQEVNEAYARKAARDTEIASRPTYADSLIKAILADPVALEQLKQALR